jgi:heptaprenyl diphosphate synthase
MVERHEAGAAASSLRRRSDEVTGFWEDSPDVARRLERIVAVIDAELGAGEFPAADRVVEMARANGKLLRPALLVIGSMFGKAADPDRIDRLAAAVELLHLATLIHDDIIDESTTRRGLPSLHTLVGVKEAVLAGDWLLARCFMLASASASPENARGLSRLVSAICSAEIDQDIGRYEFAASVREYRRTIAGKTAALFALALHAGSAEAKASERVSQSLRRSGYAIGMAFQIIDDILDFESTEDVARKTVGRDIAEGLCTLPLIYALERDPTGMRALLPRRPRAGSGADSIAAAAAAERAALLGGTGRARLDAGEYTERALTEIGRLPDCSAKERLASLAERLLARAY